MSSKRVFGSLGCDCTSIILQFIEMDDVARTLRVDKTTHAFCEAFLSRKRVLRRDTFPNCAFLNKRTTSYMTWLHYYCHGLSDVTVNSYDVFSKMDIAFVREFKNLRILHLDHLAYNPRHFFGAIVSLFQGLEVLSLRFEGGEWRRDRILNVRIARRFSCTRTRTHSRHKA